MTPAPYLIVFIWITLENFGGSFLDASSSLLSLGVREYVNQYGPRFSLFVFVAYTAWVLFQAVLYFCLPASLQTGQLTPARHLLQYHTNGFTAWIITNVLFICLSFWGILDLFVIANHWPALIVASNIGGILLSSFAYFKAHLFPSHADDRKFTSSRIYDYYMGVELNPRIGQTGDFKLFTNGRPGIVAWTLIDISFIAQQHNIHGRITSSIVAASVLHALYVVDFFVNEDWYLRTIDIAHDHYGFYLAWGSLAWLPTIVGRAGYGLFRSVNHQKDITRRTNGQCTIWGKKAEIIECDFVTQDGKQHESLLLCSGWWGLARHANYLGDLILSFSMCATCGIGHVLPWFYAIYMTVLLLHRCRRDERRCQAKYGAKWDEYVARVPWKLIPGVF
ncbi:hypothetical protein MMC25_001654 [Agyrium rufum]|nr:hypothetical protein [Agyrium rufum]